MSWRTYWTKKEDVADKMFLLTQLDDIDREEVIRSWKTGKSITSSLGGSSSTRSLAKNVTYKESSSSELSDEEPESPFSGDEPEEDEESDDDELPSTDEDEELGEAGSAFTMAETRALAKHVASQPDWFKGRKDWEPFVGNVSHFQGYRLPTNLIDLSP